MNLLSKISIGEITINTEKAILQFSYNLQDHTKELQIAAGKIHLGIAKQGWKIEAKTLTLTRSNTKTSFQEIKNLFEGMVTA